MFLRLHLGYAKLHLEAKMEDRMAMPAQPTTDAEYEAAVEAMLLEIDSMLKRMGTNRGEHGRLQARSNELLEETREIRARIEASIG